MNGALNSVSTDVHSNKTVGGKGSNFKFLAEKNYHFSENSLETTDDETVVNVEDEDCYLFVCLREDEDCYLFVCLPRTEMTVVDTRVGSASG
jgi:hypothetical protein